MSDAKARHFKPHGRFPFVTSIWWRLNNSAREQRKAHKHHRHCRGHGGIGVPSPASPSPATLLRCSFVSVILSIRCLLTNSFPSRENHLGNSSPFFHPSGPQPERSSRAPIRSHLSCAIGLVKPPLFQPPTFKPPSSNPFLSLPLLRPQCHATSTIPPLRPAVTDNRLSLSLSRSLSLSPSPSLPLSANEKLTLDWCKLHTRAAPGL